MQSRIEHHRRFALAAQLLLAVVALLIIWASSARVATGDDQRQLPPLRDDSAELELVRAEELPLPSGLPWGLERGPAAEAANHRPTSSTRATSQPTFAELQSESVDRAPQGMSSGPLGACIVRAAQSLTLSAEVAGLVTEVAVQVDDSIEAGTLLLSLDDRDAAIARQHAEIELQRAQVAVERAKAVTVQAKNTVRYRREELERNEQLGKNVLESELRRLREAVERAEVEHVVAYNEYLQAGQLVETARLQIRTAEILQSRLAILAPAAGQVVKLAASVGERVEVGEPLLELRNLQHMLCEVEVAEASPDVAAMVGRRVIATAEVAGEQHRFTGRIVSLGHEVNADGKLSVRVEIENQRYSNRWLLSHGSPIELTLAN